jgi:zinc-ribbon domain
MIQLSCPKCGSAHRPGARFCIHCGQPLPSEAAPHDQTPASKPRGRSRALAGIGGVCLLVVVVLAVATLFVAMRRPHVVDTSPHATPLRPTPEYLSATEPTPEYATPVKPTPRRATPVKPTPQPEVENSFPPQLVGQWAYSDDNGSWLYVFNGDGSYQRVFEGGMVAQGCTITIERHEEGSAAVDSSSLVLRIRSGEKTTTDSCDSSSNAIRDLAGTTETIALEADFDGDRIVQLYVDRLPLRPYNSNS